MTPTQRVMIANPQSSFYGRCGSVQGTKADSIYLVLEVTLGHVCTIPLPFHKSELVIAPPKRR